MKINGATKGINLNGSATGIQNNSSEKEVTIYPNPATNEIYINYSNANVTGTTTMSLTDLSGRLVYYEKIHTTGEFTKRIDVASISKGIYILNVTTFNETINKKVIIE